MLQDTEIK